LFTSKIPKKINGKNQERVLKFVKDIHDESIILNVSIDIAHILLIFREDNLE
jgi:hypothetical protein